MPIKNEIQKYLQTVRTQFDSLKVSSDHLAAGLKRQAKNTAESGELDFDEKMELFYEDKPDSESIFSLLLYLETTLKERGASPRELFSIWTAKVEVIQYTIDVCLANLESAKIAKRSILAQLTTILISLTKENKDLQIYFANFLLDNTWGNEEGKNSLIALITTHYFTLEPPIVKLSAIFQLFLIAKPAEIEPQDAIIQRFLAHAGFNKDIVLKEKKHKLSTYPNFLYLKLEFLYSALQQQLVTAEVAIPYLDQLFSPIRASSPEMLLATLEASHIIKALELLALVCEQKDAATLPQLQALLTRIQQRIFRELEERWTPGETMSPLFPLLLIGFYQNSKDILPNQTIKNTIEKTKEYHALFKEAAFTETPLKMKLLTLGTTPGHPLYEYIMAHNNTSFTASWARTLWVAPAETATFLAFQTELTNYKSKCDVACSSSSSSSSSSPGIGRGR